MKVIGYVRVSSDKQENSADMQEKRIRAQALIKDMELSEVIVDLDEFSGDLNRPGIIKVLDMVTGKKIDAVIVTKLDRLTRSTRDAISLIELFGKKNVQLISIAEALDTVTPIGRFFVRMIASIAELEREMIGSRTREGLQNLKSQGFAVGPAPYGFTARTRTEEEKKLKVRHPLEPNPREQEVIEMIDQLRSQRKTWEVIAAALNEAGYRTRSGGEWSLQRVQWIWKSREKAA